MLVYGAAGLWLTLRVFRGIITGVTPLFFWTLKRDGGERAYGCWMAVGGLLSFALFIAALKCYLGPLWA